MVQETTGPTLPPMGGTSGTSANEDIYGEDSEETSAPLGGRHAIGRFWDDLAGFDVAHPGRSLYDDEDVKEIRRWNEAQAALIQEQLIAAGLLDPDNVQFFGKGKDPATIKAWEKLLGEANVAESTWEDLLKIRVDNETARIQLDQQIQARPLRISLTNPEELKNAFNATAWDMLGTKLTEEQLTSMTSAWHDRERSEQAEAY
ncbi:MAG: hypothetical protein GY795_45925, partial [Desulfobacterales bacterium]|nr:hypothetical protein [Desulfobacterales bacterium]